MPDPLELRADHSLLTLFPLLCRKDCHRPGATQPIPHTVAYQYGFFKAWYYYDTETGEIAERERKYCTPDDILEVFSAGSNQCAAVFMYRKAGFLAEVTEEEATSVEFLSREGLVAFLGKVGPRPDGLLQKFVPPHGASNAIIQATWSPHVTVLTHRKNIHSLGDKRLPLHDRCVTHEGQQHLSREMNCTTELVARFAAVCRRLSDHCAAHSRVMLHRMVLFFKVDPQDRVVLLWPSTLIVSRGAVRRLPPAFGAEEAPVPDTSVLDPMTPPSLGARMETGFGTDLASVVRSVMPTRRPLLNLSPNFSNPRDELLRQQEAGPAPDPDAVPYCVVPEGADETMPAHLAKAREARMQQQRAMRDVLQQAPTKAHRRMVPSKVRRRLQEAKEAAIQAQPPVHRQPAVQRRLGPGWRRQRRGPGNTRSELLPGPSSTQHSDSLALPMHYAAPTTWMYLPLKVQPAMLPSTALADALLAELSPTAPSPAVSEPDVQREDSGGSPVETTPCPASPTDTKAPTSVSFCAPLDLDEPVDLDRPLDLDALLALFAQPLRGTRRREVAEWLDDLAYKAYQRPLERRGSLEFTVPRIVRKYLGSDLGGLARLPGVIAVSPHEYWVDLDVLAAGSLAQEAHRVRERFLRRFEAVEGRAKAPRDTPWDTDSDSSEDIRF